jgi:hypothetical protein
VLGVIRQSEKYEPTLLLEAWRRFEKEGTGENGNLTVQELAEKFVARQKAEGRSARTVIDDRWPIAGKSKRWDSKHVDHIACESDDPVFGTLFRTDCACNGPFGKIGYLCCQRSSLQTGFTREHWNG